MIIHDDAWRCRVGAILERLRPGFLWPVGWRQRSMRSFFLAIFMTSSLLNTYDHYLYALLALAGTALGVIAIQWALR